MIKVNEKEKMWKKKKNNKKRCKKIKLKDSKTQRVCEKYMKKERIKKLKYWKKTKTRKKEIKK